MSLSFQTMKTMVLKSQELQQLLRQHGFAKPGSGSVTAAGCNLVRQVAKLRGLRDWPDTRTPEDYDALIAAVTAHFQDNGQD